MHFEYKSNEQFKELGEYLTVIWTLVSCKWFCGAILSVTLSPQGAS